jgi:hypothetical protein
MTLYSVATLSIAPKHYGSVRFEWLCLAGIDGGPYFWFTKDAVHARLKQASYLIAIREDWIFDQTVDPIAKIYPQLDSEICCVCKARIFPQCRVALPNAGRAPIDARPSEEGVPVAPTEPALSGSRRRDDNVGRAVDLVERLVAKRQRARHLTGRERIANRDNAVAQTDLVELRLLEFAAQPRKLVGVARHLSLSPQASD